MLTGNTALSGSYATGLLSVGQAASGTAIAVPGQLDIGPNTAVTAATGMLASGDLLCVGVAAVLNVTGTLALGAAGSGVGQADTLLAVSGRGNVHLGGLTLGGDGSDSVSVAFDAYGDGDTLVGAPGTNSTFFASLHTRHGGSTLPIDVYIHGGGNDYIYTGSDNAAITTSGADGTNYHSTVAFYSGQISVLSYGSDTIAAQGLYGSDSVTSAGAAGTQGDIVAAPGQGILSFTNSAASSTVVGSSGSQMQIVGNSGPTLVWAGDADVTYYKGGSGAATIVGGSGYTSVQGGSGPVTVFGGTGSGVFSGAAGSVFVVGTGASTVNASAGNLAFISGAAPVSIVGSSGVNVYAGGSTGDNIFQAHAGNETLWGGAGDDTFYAGTSNDILVGGGGNDVFSFGNGTVTGVDTVVGFVAGADTIALHGFGTQTPTLSTAYGDTIISLQNGAQIIVLNDTHMTGADFTFS